ncbi:MAG: DinB family protein [Chloroflexi bacterium]|nr:DinB family protein [Chloroflexota bacterium]
MAASNPKVEEIRQSVRSSYEELNRLIDGPLASMNSAQLYQSPEPGEWTLMENVAHIIEFMPYWGDEIAKLVATPGQNFGRTHQHAGRLKGIEEHRADNLAQAKAVLPGSYERLDSVLSSLKDSDLELKGHHSKYGDQTLGWYIEEFVTHHFAGHIKQMKRIIPST